MAEEPANLVDLIEQANRLKGMRAEVVRGINELFATIAEIAESEKEGKYGALVKLAARMQDERDKALRELETANKAVNLLNIEREEIRTRLLDGQRERAEAAASMVGALTIRNAALAMRDHLDRMANQPMKDKAGATMAGVANKLVVKFDKDVGDYIHDKGPIPIPTQATIKRNLSKVITTKIDHALGIEVEEEKDLDLAPVPHFVKNKIPEFRAPHSLNMDPDSWGQKKAREARQAEDRT